MRKESQRPTPPGTILVVANNHETLDGMHAYLTHTGVPALSRRAMNPLAELSPAVQALVVFPDDFPAYEVSTYLSMVRTRRPELTIVVVTREPPVYAAMSSTDGHPLNARILPKPAFGWTILDAIRSA